MLEIDLNEHDQGAHWLAGNVRERQRKIDERVTATLRARYERRRKEIAPDKAFDENQARDESGRWTSGGGESGSGESGAAGGRGGNISGEIKLDPNLADQYIVRGTEPPRFTDPVGIHEWADIYEPEKIKGDIAKLNKQLEQSQAATNKQAKTFIQANAGVLANLKKLGNKTGQLSNEMNVLWDRESKLMDRSLDDPERVENAKAMHDKFEELKKAQVKEINATEQARDKARAAFTKSARAAVGQPIKLEANIYSDDIGIAVESGKALRFLQGIVAAEHPDVEAKTGGKFVIPIKQVGKDEKQRAYHQNGVVAIGTWDSAATVVHEIGHAIEWRYPGVARAARAFLMRRVGDESPVDMQGQFPRHGFDAGETGRKNDFLKGMARGEESDAYYVGKHYAHGATEIMSMGLEQLYRDPANFARRDPDYFNFVTGVLRGDIR